MIREPHYFDDLPVFANQIDIICEHFHLSEEVKTHLKDAVDYEVAIKFSKAAAFLTKPTRNIRARIYGLIFAAGLNDLNSISQASIAEQLGCSRALINHYTKEWREYLNLKPLHIE